ncbi:MAG: flagellar M-ring protein FliF [Deltaproteobacteria bacterium]|nr:flagellar M-ring protein FliF [Deltaproteobacteria bacterium]
MALSFANIQEHFKKLGPAKTAGLLGVVAFVIAALVVLLLWNKGPEYQTLYSQLSEEDAGQVIEKLKEKKIPYKVDGSKITIPADKVHETRMQLAGEGLPQGGGIGFEIFDKTSFGVTDYVQKINYKRALQGELARTISQIKEIENARVHLSLPEKGVFLDDQKKATASVIVKLKQGKTLNPGQVSSIVHLVANSSENLNPEDIAVVDTAGRMWTKPSEGDDALKLTSSQLEYKRSIEKDLETRLQSMLEKAVGVDNVVARVAVDVDSKHVERTEETYDPDSQVIRSEHRNREKTIGGSMVMGVPGVLSNLPESKNNAAANATPAQSQRSDEVINYEINKVTSHVVEPLGGIKRLTVSVLLDGSYETTKGADGKEVRKYNARTEEEISKFSDMVKGAVGFDQQRGDVITVVSTPFESDYTEAGMEAEKAPVIPPYMVPSIIKYSSILLIAILAIFFVLRPITKKLTESEKTADQNALPEGLQASLPAGAELALEAGSMDDGLEKIKRAVKDNPQQVAMVLKGWIKER